MHAAEGSNDSKGSVIARRADTMKVVLQQTSPSSFASFQVSDRCLEIANRVRGMGEPGAALGGAGESAGARVTHAAEGSNDPEAHLATPKADTLKPVLQHAAPSSVESCRSNPFDGIRNCGLGAMRTLGGQLGSEKGGHSQSQVKFQPSYSRRLSKCSEQVLRQDSASFITVKELTQKMKHTSWCTREGEDLRRLLNSIRELERS